MELDAIVFGGRRASNVPLVTQATSWRHGVFMGATMSSEQTAAAEGTVGAVRRDPFAMLPFTGYNMADYWSHWLGFEKRAGVKLPQIFRVNWFLKNSRGEFIWPGFGENARVLRWITERIEGATEAVSTPIGLLPELSDLLDETLGLDSEHKQALLAWEADLTRGDLEDIGDYFAKFEAHLPIELETELKERLAMLE